MENMNKKSIVFGLKILSILAFSLLVIPTQVSAYGYGTNYTYSTGGGYFGNEVEVNNPVPSISSINPKSSNIGVGTKTITITGSNFIPSSVARINGVNRSVTFIDDSHLLIQINGNDISAYRTNGGFFITVFNGAPGGGYSNAVFFTVNNPAPVVTNTNNNNSTTNFNDTTYSNTTVQPDNFVETNESYSNLTSNAIFGTVGFLPSGLVQWVLFAIIILVIVIIIRTLFGRKDEYDELPMKHA